MIRPPELRSGVEFRVAHQIGFRALVRVPINDRDALQHCMGGLRVSNSRWCLVQLPLPNRDALQHCVGGARAAQVHGRLQENALLALWSAVETGNGNRNQVSGWMCLGLF
jgi:hypothetical protein